MTLNNADSKHLGKTSLHECSNRWCWRSEVFIIHPTLLLHLDPLIVTSTLCSAIKMHRGLHAPWRYTVYAEPVKHLIESKKCCCMCFCSDPFHSHKGDFVKIGRCWCMHLLLLLWFITKTAKKSKSADTCFRLFHYEPVDGKIGWLGSWHIFLSLRPNAVTAYCHRI